MTSDMKTIAVISLGYVGLPLAVEFGKSRPVIGFDINGGRNEELRAGRDAMQEVSAEELTDADDLSYTIDPADLAAASIYIVTVTTSIDAHKRPDLTPLIKASETLGRVSKRDDIVIHSSTVYPGATEEDCVPVLERESGLTFNNDFFAGYSPERINPGDKQHRLPDIRKVISGSTSEVAEEVDQLYASIVTAGTYKAESICVAETAKMIENTQRDFNIALLNELKIIYNKTGNDTDAVLKAASTKWSFLPFRPGLVGGHCIGVNPYYLTHEAEAMGYHPQVILAGRRINDGMGGHMLVKAMLKRRLQMNGGRVLILGLPFKKNCPDLQNTSVVDVVADLRGYGLQVDVHDPWVNLSEAKHEYGLDLVTTTEPAAYDGVILAVTHDSYRDEGATALRGYGGTGHVFCYLESVFAHDESDLRL